MMDLRSYFSVALSDVDAGILIPEQDRKRAPIGITHQFLRDADNYAERYANEEHFRWLIQNALAGLDFGGAVESILDVGSGAGNSVFPCLDLFPEANLVATDLSPDLLAILKRRADAREDHGRLGYVCMDACSPYYRPGSFDLVVGAAVLHHLIDPAAALRAIHGALRPGGIALFLEPFENGHAILRLAYETLLAKSEQPALSPDARRFLSAMAAEYRLRAGSDKSAEIFERIDDKWLFTPAYFRRAAKELGFSEPVIRPIHDTIAPFSRQTEVNLRLAMGLGCDGLPSWAWDVLAYHDTMFSPELRQDLFLEASIVLRR